MSSGFTNAVNAEQEGVQYIDTTGAWTGVDGGTAGHVLTSNGTNMAPSFQAAAGGGITTIDGNTGNTGASTTPTITTGASNTQGTALFKGDNTSSLTLSFTDSNENTGIGESTLNNMTTANNNSAFGRVCLRGLTTGNSNAVFGHNSLFGITTGSNNSIFGCDSWEASISSASYNCGLGVQQAGNYTGTESSNILIGYLIPGSTGESNVLRIGNGTGTGNGQLNKAFIQGIASVAVSNKQYVTIDTSTGQMGSDAGPVSPVAFYVTLGTAVPNATGDGTSYHIIYDTASLNPGTNYSTGTGLWTAPATGVYSFTALLGLTGVTVAYTHLQFFLNINGGTNYYLTTQSPLAEATSGQSQYTLSQSYTLSLTAGDTVAVYINVANSTKTIQVDSLSSNGLLNSFSGFRIS